MAVRRSSPYNSCIHAIKILPLTRHGAELRTLALRSREVVVLAALVGFGTGLGVAVFDRIVAVEMLDRLLAGPAWLIAVAPVAGLLLSTAILKAGGGLTPSTSDEYIANVHLDSDLELPPLPWRLAAAVASLGSGVPGGLEGPSIYLGAGLGTAVQAWFRRAFGPTAAKTLMIAGAAAGVAAIFKAPATGAVFALEVPYRDDLARHQLVPSLVGAASGYLAFVALNGTQPLLEVIGRAPFDVRDLLGAVALGIGTGLIIRSYAAALRRAKSFRSQVSPWAAAALGGVVVAGAALAGRSLTGEWVGLTPGYDVIVWAAEPGHGLGLLLLVLGIRLVGTVASVAGGGVIGLFVPLVVAGALIGQFAGGLLDAPNSTLFVVIGVAAALGAGYRVPLAAIVFVAEATGRPDFLVPGLFAAVAADLIMGTSSVTDYQRSGAQAAEAS
ncbi:MAG TPA: chloride channel protein [Acidimicrobiales bacterium]|nr:chloride channel protein [Acidimicrobiales bacterium]